MTATLHLVRHGEVENPHGVVYGHLPGYELSERGRRQAREAAERLSSADVACVWASPLERVQATAELIASTHDLGVITDERLTESHTTLEGLSSSLLSFFRSPKHWWSFRNPMRPSWGESFAHIRARMLSAVEEALASAEGREVVIVSHQTPVLVARLALTRRRIPPWLTLLRCHTGSVTTLVLDGKEVISVSYFRPSE